MVKKVQTPPHIQHVQKKSRNQYRNNLAIKSNSTDYFGAFMEKYSTYIFLGSLLLIGIIVFKDFIFGNKLYLYKDIGSDSININYPAFFHKLSYFKNFGVLKWSFYQGMGQNVFPQNFKDPFSIILLLFGARYLAYGIIYMEFAKIICAGLFFYLFLKKLSLSPFAVIIGGLLFAYSGFIVLGSCWNIFSLQAVYFALLLYSFERVYQNNQWILYTVAVSLIAVNQVFDLLLFGLFLFFYILFRLLEENNFSFKKISVLFAKIIGFGALGVAIGFIFVVADIIQMLESPRGGGGASFYNKLASMPVFGFEGNMKGPGHYFTAILRFFSNDILGTGSNYKGWRNYLEAPIFYCGLINLLLVPQVFISINKRKRILYLIFIVLFIIPVVFPFFRYAIWAFSGNYYRFYSLLVAFVLLLFSIKALSFIDKNHKVNLVLLIISLLILLVALFYPYNIVTVNHKVQNIVAVFLVVYALLIFLLKYKKVRPVIQSILFILIVIELIYFSGITVNDRLIITKTEFRQKVGYNDFTVDAVDYLNVSNGSFFRINKDYASSLSKPSYNDAFVQNYYGTPSYNSFNQKYFIRFLEEMQIIHSEIESQTRWAIGLMNSPLLHGMASIKYTLTKSHKSDFYLKTMYDSVAAVNDVKIFKNKYFIPLGFTYNKFISEKNFHKLSGLQKSYMIYLAVVVNDSINKINGIPELKLKDTIPDLKNYTWDDYKKSIENLQKDTLLISQQSQNSIKGSIKTDSSKLLFFQYLLIKDGWQRLMVKLLVRYLRILVS